MRRTIVLLAICAATVTAAGTASASPTASIVIRHQTRGCHTWSADGAKFSARQRLVVRPTTTLTFTDNDLMPQRLIQLSGPKVKLVSPAMHKPGAHASVRLVAKGTYVFGTKPGEDYMKGVVTKGADNVLKLTVVVR